MRISVVGQALNSAELIQVARSTCADLIVAEAALLESAVARDLRGLGETMPQVHCIALTRRLGPFGIPLPPAPDADLHLYREDDLQNLPQIIADVHDGLAGAGSRPAARHAAASVTPRGESALTTREIDVLRLLAVGASDDEIATRLGIRARTVESHRISARRRLRIETSRQLMVYAAAAFGGAEPIEQHVD